MKHWRSWAGVVLLATCLAPLAALGDEAAPRPAIPFKTEPSPVQEFGGRLAVGLIILLGLSGAVIYLAKKRLPAGLSMAGLTLQGKRLRVIERARLNPRCSLFLVKIDDKEVLLGQCGDSLVQLEASPAREAT